MCATSSPPSASSALSCCPPPGRRSWRAPGRKSPLVITSGLIELDAFPCLLEISGDNFGDGMPTVIHDRSFQQVLSHTPNPITAESDCATVSGDYLLEVERSGMHPKTSFDLLSLTHADADPTSELQVLEYDPATKELSASPSGNPVSFLVDGPCYSNVNHYADCGNGVGTDGASGLTWPKNARCAGQMDWAAANDWAAGPRRGTPGAPVPIPGKGALPRHRVSGPGCPDRSSVTIWRVAEL